MDEPGPALRPLLVSSHAQLGGSEWYLAALIAGLGDRVAPHVVSLEPGPLVDLLEGRGVPVTVLRAGRRAGLLRAAGQLRATVADLRPSLVHANGVKAALVVALARPPAPTVWVKHDHSRDGLLGRCVARRFQLVVGVSGSVLAPLGGRVRTRVVPPGVRVPDVDPTDARRVAVAAAGGRPGPLLACVGRLDPAKGFDTAIDVLERVRRVVPTAVLLVVGGPEPRHPDVGRWLRSRAEQLGLADSVVLTGHRDDAAQLVAGADVVLITSRAVHRRGMGREGFGLVAAEALSLGTPVAGFADGGVPESVGEAGLLVSPGDVEALSAAVVRLLNEPELTERLVAAGRTRASRYDEGRWIESMLSVYRELAAIRQ